MEKTPAPDEVDRFSIPHAIHPKPGQGNVKTFDEKVRVLREFLKRTAQVALLPVTLLEQTPKATAHLR